MPGFGSKLILGTEMLLRCFQDDTCKKKHPVWDFLTGTVSALEAFSCLKTGALSGTVSISVQPGKATGKELSI